MQPYQPYLETFQVCLTGDVATKQQVANFLSNKPIDLQEGRSYSYRERVDGVAAKILICNTTPETVDRYLGAQVWIKCPGNNDAPSPTYNTVRNATAKTFTFVKLSENNLTIVDKSNPALGIFTTGTRPKILQKIFESAIAEVKRSNQTASLKSVNSNDSIKFGIALISSIVLLTFAGLYIAGGLGKIPKLAFRYSAVTKFVCAGVFGAVGLGGLGAAAYLGRRLYKRQSEVTQ